MSSNDASITRLGGGRCEGGDDTMTTEKVLSLAHDIVRSTVVANPNALGIQICQSDELLLQVYLRWLLVPQSAAYGWACQIFGICYSSCVHSSGL